MATVILTAGPIPTRLDSVKFITNRFKGGLAIATAEKLQQLGHSVKVIAWKYLEVKTDLEVIRVDDVYHYYQTVLNTSAESYILAAAVANLGPVKPYEGKFPSHNYSVGDVFSIDFTIMPRVIDAIKLKYPTSSLVGYKLYDGSDAELIKAAQQTLYESKANIVFANKPATAKDHKLVIPADGAVFPVSFDEHVNLINRLLHAQYYRTQLVDTPTPKLTDADEFVASNYPKAKNANLIFGTFAVRKEDGFITTTRGKKTGEKDVAFIQRVDHRDRVIFANKKATLNAPLLHALLEKNPQINYLLHGHELIGEKVQTEYQFPGTTGDLLNVIVASGSQLLIQLPYHGYIAGFSELNDCKKFVAKNGSVE